MYGLLIPPSHPPLPARDAPRADRPPADRTIPGRSPADAPVPPPAAAADEEG